jgi:hypothetical protein
MKVFALIAVVVAVAVSATSAGAGGVITDTLAPGGGSASVSPAISSPFSWADAGLGAGMAAGALLALLGGVLVVNRRNVSVAV